MLFIKSIVIGFLTLLVYAMAFSFVSDDPDTVEAMWVMGLLIAAGTSAYVYREGMK